MSKQTLQFSLNIEANDIVKIAQGIMATQNDLVKAVDFITMVLDQKF